MFGFPVPDLPDHILYYFAICLALVVFELGFWPIRLMNAFASI
jgi:hypothetical protein